MNACMRGEEGEGSLPIQEKRAWLEMVTIAVVYGALLANVLGTPAEALTVVRFVVLFTVAIIVQSIILAIGNSIFAARDPEGTRAPLDERDRLVARRATTAAYGTLMSVVFLLGFALPYYATAGWQTTLAMIMAMSVADLVRQAAIILNYRRNG